MAHKDTKTRSLDAYRYCVGVALKLGKDMQWVSLSTKQYIWIMRAINKCSKNGVDGVVVRYFGLQPKIFIELKRLCPVLWITRNI